MKARWIILLALIVAAAFARVSHADTATLNWGPVTTRTDGTAVTGVTYNVYQGAQGANPKTKVQSGLTVTTASITGLAGGTNTCWNVTASAGGLESVYSAEVCKAVPLAPPSAPTGLTVASNATVYYPVAQTNKLVLLAVGTCTGCACISSQSVNGLYAVDRQFVAWYGNVKPLAVYANCTS